MLISCDIKNMMRMNWPRYETQHICILKVICLDIYNRLE